MFKKIKKIELQSYNGNIIAQTVNLKEKYPCVKFNYAGFVAVEIINTKLPTKNIPFALKKGTVVFVKPNNLIKMNDYFIINENDILTYIK